SLNVAGERFCLLVSLQQLSRLGSRGNPLVAEEDLIDRLADEIGDGADEGAAGRTSTRSCFLARPNGAIDSNSPCPAYRVPCFRSRQALNASRAHSRARRERVRLTFRCAQERFTGRSTRRMKACGPDIRAPAREETMSAPMAVSIRRARRSPAA